MRKGKFYWKLDFRSEAHHGACDAGFAEIWPNLLGGFAISAWGSSDRSLGLQCLPGPLLLILDHQNTSAC